jgi:hypothetical protein
VVCLRLTWLNGRRKRIIKIDRHTVFIQCHLMVVIRRAEEPAGFVRTIVERMERVDRDYQSVPPRQTVPILLLPSGGIG